MPSRPSISLLCIGSARRGARACGPPSFSTYVAVTELAIAITCESETSCRPSRSCTRLMPRSA
eukprot:2324123-Prymnesium_polylepis.1